MTRGPRQCFRVDRLPDVRQFAASNSDGEDKMVFERFLRGFDFPPTDADDQNAVSLSYEFGRLRK
jgi:predicted component of type VI protein secretion system